MKRFIIAALALLMTAGAANAADILATTPNQLGGEIMLTAVKCEGMEEALSAISIDDGGRILLTGCAFGVRPDRIGIIWDDAGVKPIILPISAFTKVLSHDD
ncbi:MAG: hypothetical protein ACREWE_00855 [Gammaproteobacteria bacterium]